VTTDPIELEDVYLGPFEIQLALRDLRNSRTWLPCSVIALEPNASAASDSVTHPHVSNKELCPGEASAGMRASLTEGRICDFFLLVRSVLLTYNAGSAYVPLEKWEGEPCPECGDLMSEEGRFWCESCDRDYCEDCMSGCRSCDVPLCRRCAVECPVCEEPTCEGCMSECKECRRVCCASCLDDSLCAECKRNKETQHEQADEQATKDVASGA
jgi:hypothetical protein